MTPTEYYQNQLAKLNKRSDYPTTIKFVDGEGNQTNCMDLNSESIEVFIDYLKGLRSELSVDGYLKDKI